MNRTQNAVRNIIWGVVEKIASLLMPFLTRTVLIKVLGAEYLGLNSLFTSILSVLSISELGIGTAIVFSMYRPIVEKDNDLLCALLNVYRKIYYVIGSVILVCGLALTPFLRQLIHGDIPADIDIYVLYLIFLFNTVISYFLWAYKTSLFSAHQRSDLASKRSAVVNILSNLCMITALILFKNYYTYVIFIPIATIATNIINAVLAKKMFPQITCRGTISKDMRSSMKKRIAGLVSFKIYGVIFSQVDTIVISSFLGLTSLAIYNNYYYVQTAILGFLNIITVSITAGIGNKMVTCSREENYKDYNNFVFANAWLSGFCAVCLVCLYQHFMTWWVGEELTFSFHTMLLMVLYFLLPKITSLTFTYREAAGLWWEDRFRPLAAAAVNLTVNLILVRYIGIDGVIISTLLCTVFINVPWGAYILFKNYFKRSSAEYLLKVVFYVTVTAGVSAVTYAVCALLPSAGFIPMILKGFICVVVSNSLFWLVYHKLPEFDYVKRMFCTILNKLTKAIKKNI